MKTIAPNPARGVRAAREADEEFPNWSRDFFGTVFDKFPALVWRSGVDAKCDYFNQTWLDFTGKSLDQEKGNGWIEGVHPEDSASCIEEYLRAFHSREPFTLEYRLRRHDREYRWIIDNGRAYHDLSGRFAGYIGACFDVTERKRAEKQLLRSKEQLRALTGRLQTVREDESERISREIHDELGQALTGLNMDLIWMQQSFANVTNRTLRSALRRRTTAMIASLEATVRSVQRISTELRPLMLDDLGLSATLEWQAEEFAARTGVHCLWTQCPIVKLSNRDQSVALFRIFQEILTNVGRHARARSVRMSLVQHQGELILEVADDGRGFSEMKLRDHRSLGLLGIRERAALIGGGVEIQSAPGQGTKVIVTSPLPASGNSRKTKTGSPHGPKNKNPRR
jgi:PAS domain S-box-containing protein